eukprot:634464-Pyramimonas_sp.AAC.1
MTRLSLKFDASSRCEHPKKTVRPKLRTGPSQNVGRCFIEGRYMGRARRAYFAPLLGPRGPL